MQIQVNIDNFIHGDERVIEVAELAVQNDLEHLSERLTRIEVHLKDQNADKQGPDHIHVHHGGAATWQRPTVCAS